MNELTKCLQFVKNLTYHLTNEHEIQFKRTNKLV